MSVEGLRALRERVHGDPELAIRLRLVEPERFAADVLRLAAENGYDVTEADVAGARSSAQRAWTLRWVR
jgi:predicted ribosomally synthesized peptide with nif11-like leader